MVLTTPPSHLDIPRAADPKSNPILLKLWVMKHEALFFFKSQFIADDSFCEIQWK